MSVGVRAPQLFNRFDRVDLSPQKQEKAGGRSAVSRRPERVDVGVEAVDANEPGNEPRPGRLYGFVVVVIGLGVFSRLLGFRPRAVNWESQKSCIA